MLVLSMTIKDFFLGDNASMLDNPLTDYSHYEWNLNYSVGQFLTRHMDRANLPLYKIYSYFGLL